MNLFIKFLIKINFGKKNKQFFRMINHKITQKKCKNLNKLKIIIYNLLW